MANWTNITSHSVFFFPFKFLSFPDLFFSFWIYFLLLPRYWIRNSREERDRYFFENHSSCRNLIQGMYSLKIYFHLHTINSVRTVQIGKLDFTGDLLRDSHPGGKGVCEETQPRVHVRCGCNVSPFTQKYLLSALVKWRLERKRIYTLSTNDTYID